MKTRIWDIPLRLFHWTLLCLVAVSIYTGINGGFAEMDYHMLSGYGVLALVAFRIIWGVIGPANARFTRFVKPGQVPSYAKQIMQRPGIQSSGHNPLGALFVVAIVISLGIQAGTGLFATDDIFIEGPLLHLVSSDISNQLTSVHHFNSKVIYVLIGLHLLAIAFYELYKQQRLVMPMITGYKRLEGETVVETPPGLVKEMLAGFVTVTACSGAVYYLVNHV